jgi:hypothetical protein
MDDQPTCGKGLAEHSALPGKLGVLREWVERDGKMLAGMSGHPGPP